MKQREAASPHRIWSAGSERRPIHSATVRTVHCRCISPAQNRRHRYSKFPHETISLP